MNEAEISSAINISIEAGCLGRVHPYLVAEQLTQCIDDNADRLNCLGKIKRGLFERRTELPFSMPTP